MSAAFRLKTKFSPSGDQPQAIEELTTGLGEPGARHVLLGVTGSGKTFTVAQVVNHLQMPTLVVAPNKTLASQLYEEFRELFPENAVEYFVSYYDYFQPEAYLPSSDTYIEKDARVNERIDRMRNSATASLLERKDVIVVASVSCIYGLGDPETYRDLALELSVAGDLSRESLIRGLVRTQHSRADADFRPGTFRVRGNSIEIWPIQNQDRILAVEVRRDKVESILQCDPLTGEILAELQGAVIFPVGHYVQPEDKIPRALETIEEELMDRLPSLLKDGKDIPADRLERRVSADLEDLKELGFCQGIENYSRHFDGRTPGQPPFTLLNYFPKDFLLVVDESHVSLPQVYGMVKGDSARKRNLIEHGFRLPSALDNRPLAEPEFEDLLDRVLYVSATPSNRELLLAQGDVVEQIVRPTGLLDPPCEVRPATGQVEDALKESLASVEKGGRVLITTLTKRSAEDLTEFFQESGVKAKYLHADIQTLERAEILRDLRLGVFDVLVGINLLREGLDLPEVTRVLVLDADREGFLRSETSLIQTCGRAARNVEGKVVFYADQMTGSLEKTLEVTQHRRAIQQASNERNGLIPKTIQKSIREPLVESVSEDVVGFEDMAGVRQEMESLKKEMKAAAAGLDFESAIRLRDQLRRLEALELEFSE